MMVNIQIRINFGAMAEKISEQLAQQGFYIPVEKTSDRIENLNHALNMVKIHGLFSGSACDEARRRLFKMIVDQAEPIPPEVF
jgi:hypothetical protein